VRRSKLDLRIDILETLRESPKILSHIMYRTGTNSSTVNRELSILIEKGFVKTVEAPKKPKQQCKSRNRKRTFYILTMKGREVLNHISQIQDLMETS